MYTSPFESVWPRVCRVFCCAHSRLIWRVNTTICWFMTWEKKVGFKSKVIVRWCRADELPVERCIKVSFRDRFERRVVLLNHEFLFQREHIRNQKKSLTSVWLFSDPSRVRTSLKFIFCTQSPEVMPAWQDITLLLEAFQSEGLIYTPQTNHIASSWHSCCETEPKVNSDWRTALDKFACCLQ